jgi:hypothetical protein
MAVAVGKTVRPLNSLCSLSVQALIIVTMVCATALTSTVTSTNTSSADTSIDGGSLITIKNGGNSVGVSSVNTGITFQNLTVANGNSTNGRDGGIS